MSNDNQYIQVEFHNKARDIFFSLLKNFELAAKKLDRKKQEFQFNELKNQHINTLKQELESCASFLLAKNQNKKEAKELNQNLQYFIKDYLHLFVQKTRFQP